MATNLCRGDLDANGFTGTDAAIYADACHRVSPFRVSLTEAISEYEAARSKLPPGIRLSDAVSAYLLRYPEGSIQKTVSEVLAEFTRDRESAHCLAVHLSDIRSRLGQFAAAFQVPVQTADGHPRARLAAVTQESQQSPTDLGALPAGQSRPVLCAVARGVEPSLGRDRPTRGSQTPDRRPMVGTA